jgi:anti-sigma-K factor RskA
MNLANPQLLDRLAAEYVLGTLRGSARRRFERALGDEPSIRTAVAEWEERLWPLSLRTSPVVPRPDTWRRIADRVGLAAHRPPVPRRWIGRPIVLAAAVALVAVGIALWVRNQGPEFRPAAVVATTDGRPLWRVELVPGRDRMRIEVAGTIDTPAGKDFELWALPEKGAPVSLGLLPAHGRIERALGERQRRALAAARQVAVSVEPRGGSPTGAPTGPVVHVVPITVAAASTPPGALPG